MDFQNNNIVRVGLRLMINDYEDLLFIRFLFISFFLLSLILPIHYFLDIQRLMQVNHNAVPSVYTLIVVNQKIINAVTQQQNLKQKLFEENPLLAKSVEISEKMDQNFFTKKLKETILSGEQGKKLNDSLKKLSSIKNNKIIIKEQKQEIDLSEEKIIKSEEPKPKEENKTLKEHKKEQIDIMNM